MSPKRKPSHKQGGPKRSPRTAGRANPAPSRIAVRSAPGENAFELVYPASVERRKEDLEEVHAMLDAGEVNLAIDELRWLLENCRPLLEAHTLLGDIALADGDLPLARAHLGYAYELGLSALPSEGLPGPLPYARSANRPFFEAGKGLAYCLEQVGETALAADVTRQLLALDPSDPLRLRSLPIVPNP